ncbi:MAG: LytTR family DNA-binding domain-containing protein [Bacteroidetes bacterium]|nr:LytTR family DNA-binding domain-containing protein [Bacteroidota bacterium]
MKKCTAYIVDDEPLAIRSLTKKLEDFPEIELVGQSTRMPKAIVEIETFKPDILFLDIQLMEGTGFDLLNQINFAGQVIFVTAFDEYAFRAFEINALDYILKPVSNERLKSALEKLSDKNIDNNKQGIRYKITDRILILERHNMKFVLVSSIEIIEASRDYTTIKTSEGKSHLILRSMREWEESLPSEHFIRIHRSYIVNINNIISIERTSSSTGRVFLKNFTNPITLSRTYYKNARINYL